MNKQTITIFAIIAMFGLFSTIIATSQTSLVLAKKPSDPNCFGEAASDFGKSGQMGKHSSSFDEPRQGIGNLDGHPSELAGQLGADCD
jgi:hypothetical protein